MDNAGPVSGTQKKGREVRGENPKTAPNVFLSMRRQLSSPSLVIPRLVLYRAGLFFFIPPISYIKSRGGDIARTLYHTNESVVLFSLSTHGDER